MHPAPEMAPGRNGSGPRPVDEIRSSRRTLILVGIAILIIWAILIPLLLI
jgi:hypothetical protein